MRSVPRNLWRSVAVTCGLMLCTVLWITASLTPSGDALFSSQHVPHPSSFTGLTFFVAAAASHPEPSAAYELPVRSSPRHPANGGAAPLTSSPTGEAGDSNDLLLPPHYELARLPERVLDWRTAEVARWMETVVGYKEYTPYIWKHLVDGVMLLEMSGSDFESYFPIETPLHAIKIQAHIKLLRRQCRCVGDAEAQRLRREQSDAARGGVMRSSVWQLIRAHTRTTCFLGYLSSHFSRVGMLTIYWFYPEVYRGFVHEARAPQDELFAFREAAQQAAERDDGLYARGPWNSAVDPLTGLGATTTTLSAEPATEVAQPQPEMMADNATTPRKKNRLRVFLYWACFLVAPDLYFSVWSFAKLGASYFVMPILGVHFIVQGIAEYQLLYNLLRGQSPLRSQPWSSWFWTVYGIDPVFPLVGFLVSYLPVVLAYLATVLLTLWLLFLSLAALFVFLAETFGRVSENTGDDPKSETSGEGNNENPQSSKSSGGTTTAAAGSSSSDRKTSDPKKKESPKKTPRNDTNELD